MNEKSLNTSVLLFACTNIILCNAVIYKNILTRGHAVAQVVGHWFINALPLAQYQVISCEIRGGRSGTTAGFSLLIMNPPLLHTHLSPPPEVWDSPD
jgi:hypothetical protein